MNRLFLYLIVCLAITGCSRESKKSNRSIVATESQSQSQTQLAPPTLNELDRIFPREISSKEDEAECWMAALKKPEHLKDITEFGPMEIGMDKGCVMQTDQDGWTKYYPGGKRIRLNKRDSSTWDLNIFDSKYEIGVFHITMNENDMLINAGDDMAQLMRSSEKMPFQRVGEWNMKEADRLEKFALAAHAEVFR